jgi:hypothetical protein
MEQPFDALARALANGEISRRKALRQFGGALLGTVLVSLGIGCDSESATGPEGTSTAFAKIGCKALGKKCKDGSQCCSGNCVQGLCTQCPAGQSSCGGTCCPDGQCCNGQCCSGGLVCGGGGVCLSPCNPCNPCNPGNPCDPINPCGLSARRRAGAHARRGPAGLARGKLKG